jgi:hypothetical protein
MPAGVDQGESPSTSHARQTRSFLRAFVATNYLLGKRRQGLALGVAGMDPLALGAVSELIEQLSHGVQENRARSLAAEVGRLMRSLAAQRLK